MSVALAAGMSVISPNEMFLHWTPSQRWIDVRDAHELDGPLGHIVGVENVPLAELAAAAADWNRDDEIIVLCRSGGRSVRAADLLFELGFTRVRNLIGGMMAWHFAELPVAARHQSRRRPEASISCP